MDRSLVTTRLTNSLLVGFAATALLLALTGIYGVMSLNVANRRSEFGIRLALGAQTSNVLKLILGQGLRLAMVGVALGLLAAVAFTRLLKGFAVWHQRERSVDVCGDRCVAGWCCFAGVLDSGAKGDESRSA